MSFQYTRIKSNRNIYFYFLTHWGRVTHICGGNLTIIGSDNGLSPSHYLNHCWNIVNWTPRNKLHWNFNRNSNIFIQENSLQNVACEMASICLGLNVLINSTHNGFKFSVVYSGNEWFPWAPFYEHGSNIFRSNQTFYRVSSYIISSNNLLGVWLLINTGSYASIWPQVTLSCLIQFYNSISTHRTLSLW